MSASSLVSKCRRQVDEVSSQMTRRASISQVENEAAIS